MLKKRLFIYFLSLVAILLPAPAFSNDEIPALVGKIRPAVVLITSFDGKGNTLEKGTGFFINSQGELITNRHVLYGCAMAAIKTASGESIKIKGISAEDKESDIVRAVADTGSRNMPFLPLSTSMPEVGEKILVIGNPLGLELTVSDGIVSAIRDISGFGTIIQLTAPISPGSSGSPVINTRGEVVGIATFQLVKGQNLNFAVPTEKFVKIQSEQMRTLPDWASNLSGNWQDTAEGLYNKGLSLILAEDYKGALPYLEKAIRANPAYIDAYFKIGYVYGFLNRYQDAAGAFKKVIMLRPDYADAYYNLGVAYGWMGKSADEIEAYKKAIRLNPNLSSAYYNLGNSYGDLGRYNEAIEAYKQAIRTKPDYTSAFFNMGIVLEKTGKNEAALESYRQAIKIDPDHAGSHYNIGILFHKSGNSFAALSEYKILKSLNKKLADKLFEEIYNTGRKPSPKPAKN